MLHGFLTMGSLTNDVSTSIQALGWYVRLFL
jgi:hypothetical protein